MKTIVKDKISVSAEELAKIQAEDPDLTEQDVINIKQAKADFEKGIYFTHDEVMEEIRKNRKNK